MRLDESVSSSRQKYPFIPFRPSRLILIGDRVISIQRYSQDNDLTCQGVPLRNNQTGGRARRQRGCSVEHLGGNEGALREHRRFSSQDPWTSSAQNQKRSREMFNCQFVILWSKQYPQTHCSGHGQCVVEEASSGKCELFESAYDGGRIKCECDENFYGRSCNKQHPAFFPGRYIWWFCRSFGGISILSLMGREE